MSARYRINAPKIIHEIVEDEVVFVDRENGHYFSLAGAGADAVRALERGQDAAGIAAELSARYDADPSAVRAAVDELLARLVREGLAVERTDASPPAPAPSAPSAKRPFRAPALQKYTDVEDLLRLDPIHEVDDTGWPTPKPGPPA